MGNRGLGLSAGVVLLSAAWTAACAPARKPSSVSAPPARASRAVLLSIDGMAGERLSRLLEEPGKLPAGGLAELVRSGFFAVRSVPCTPSLTSAAHATHVTGALPRDTGIVGNLLLDPSKPFGARRSGFETPLRAETLCEAAGRQGKRVGVMAYPHAGGTPPTGCAGFGMNWVAVPVARPRIARFSTQSWSDAKTLPGTTFSPARGATLDFPPTSHRVPVVALDTMDDGKVAYDRLRIEPEVGGARIVSAGDSFPVEVRGRKGRSGAWCKLLSLAADLSNAEIYCGGIWESDAWPDDFRREIDERAGFWPGRADSGVFGARSNHPEIYIEQSDRLTEFLAKADLAALARPDWDLLFLYLSEVDAVEHEFLLADPRQEGYTPERSARYAGFIDHSYADADRAVARFRKLLTPGDALFVTSDHGMTPLRTEIYPAELLVENGFLRAAPDGAADPSSAAVALASSGIGHVYVNPAAPPGTLDSVERLFAGFRVGGESPWDRLVRRAAAGDIGLDAPESGDLIVLAKPGVHFSMRMKPGLVSGPAEEYGGHGYRAAYRDLDATFLAAGAGVAPGRVEEMPSELIASRVAAALGIAPPKQARRN